VGLPFFIQTCYDKSLQPEEGGGQIVGEGKGDGRYAAGCRPPRPGGQIGRHQHREVRSRRRRPKDNNLFADLHGEIERAPAVSVPESRPWVV